MRVQPGLVVQEDREFKTSSYIAVSVGTDVAVPDEYLDVPDVALVRVFFQPRPYAPKQHITVRFDGAIEVNGETVWTP